jgi:hypothetical protein
MTEHRANAQWLVDGFRNALARYERTAHSRDARERFEPLFETLNWAAPIFHHEDGIAGATTEDDEQVSGLRFARNRTHHQWALAIYWREQTRQQSFRVGGHGATIGSPTVIVDWFWRRADELPQGRDYGINEYRARLESKAVSLAVRHFDWLLEDLGYGPAGAS